MALRLYPFRQYSDHDVINMFANQIVDDNPSTDGDGSAGVLVKVLSGNLKKDVVDFAASSSYLGKTDYPFLGADKYPQVPLRCIAATTGAHQCQKRVPDQACEPVMFESSHSRARQSSDHSGNIRSPDGRCSGRNHHCHQTDAGGHQTTTCMRPGDCHG